MEIMSTKAPLFRQLGPLTNESGTVLALLEMGLTSEHCERVGIHTSKRGMTILLNGRKLCDGKNVRACLEKFKQMQERAKAAGQ